MRKSRLVTMAVLASLAIGAFAAALTSGVNVGKKLPAFEPVHVTGPDKNTETCPVCKYGSRPAVQVWVNTDDPKNVGKIAAELEKATKKYAGKEFKAFVVFMNPKGMKGTEISKTLSSIASANKLKNVALTYLPNAKAEPVKDYGINASSQVKNTVFVYKDRTVSTKFVNFKADAKSIKALVAAIDKVNG